MKARTIHFSAQVPLVENQKNCENLQKSFFEVDCAFTQRLLDLLARTANIRKTESSTCMVFDSIIRRAVAFRAAFCIRITFL